MATRSLPFVIQPILGATLLAAWLLGNSLMPWGAASSNGARLLAAIGLSAVITVLVAAGLFSRDSALLRGVGLSIAASAAIVVIAGGGFALSIL
ncbi:hypothetical protein [Mycolicibacterium llatzerense]|uniref:hypothetical protein n=1 Tax=Mycolicibacterium llatzerense TaxID=280871 RepID=UPI0008DC884E|nr:hypothetical protein [Mycolicibacterium llatzerense]